MTTITSTSRGRRLITAAVLAVALPATLAFAGTASAANRPATAGTPSAPVNLFTEDFENDTAGTPVLLNDYTGAAPLDETYTADPAWLSPAQCNGLILSEQDPPTQPAGISCNGYWGSALLFGEAFGSWEGTDPATNHALVGYTNGDPGVNSVKLQTNTPIPLPSANRFLVIRSDDAAQNCFAAHPLDEYSVLDGATALPTSSSPIDPCADPGAVIDGTDVGTYTGDQAVLFTGTAAGIQLVDEQGVGGGNDGAVDNIELLDATPQLDLSATTGGIPVGETAHLTFTVTNTSELDAKDGWSFTANLPSGLTLADSSVATTCASGTAAAGSAPGTVDVGGDLTSGQSSCTVTVDVTSIYGGTYSLCGSSITNPVGVNLPGCTSLNFVAPVFDARANSARLTSPLLNIGPLVPSGYECKTVAGSDTNGGINASLGTLGSLGTLDTAASGAINSANGTRTAAADAQTANVDLLGGLITANEVDTTAQAQQPLTSTGLGPVATAGTTTFTNLRVAGVAISANPGPNTTISLPLVGSVVLNQQTPVAGGDGITVTALDVTLLTGTQLTISQSTAALLSASATCPVS